MASRAELREFAVQAGNDALFVRYLEEAEPKDVGCARGLFFGRAAMSEAMLEWLTNAAVAMRPSATVSVMLDFARSFMISSITAEGKYAASKRQSWPALIGGTVASAVN